MHTGPNHDASRLVASSLSWGLLHLSDASLIRTVYRIQCPPPNAMVVKTMDLTRSQRVLSHNWFLHLGTKYFSVINGFGVAPRGDAVLPTVSTTWSWSRKNANPQDAPGVLAPRCKFLLALGIEDSFLLSLSLEEIEEKKGGGGKEQENRGGGISCQILLGPSQWDANCHVACTKTIGLTRSADRRFFFVRV